MSTSTAQQLMIMSARNIYWIYFNLLEDLTCSVALRWTVLDQLKCMSYQSYPL